MNGYDVAVWAIADLHLAIGVPSKNMDIFGPQWANYMEKIKTHWLELVGPEDLVLIAGDISWAMKENEVRIDLEWIDALPGTKVFVKGNHDYWWSSMAKMAKFLPPSCHAIHNNAFHWNDVSIAGSRLWDTVEYFFDSLSISENIDLRTPHPQEDEKVFVRELQRLELSLQSLKKEAKVKIAMTHYPPIGLHLEPSRASRLFEKYGVTHSVFGHLHNVPPGLPLFGEKRGISYHLTSSDYLNFIPIRLIKN